jgi:hypothetical protein
MKLALVLLLAVVFAPRAESTSLSCSDQPLMWTLTGTVKEVVTTASDTWPEQLDALEAKFGPALVCAVEEVSRRGDASKAARANAREWMKRHA